MTDQKEALEHLTSHITYPATKEQIIAACENMGHLSEDDRKVITDGLADGKEYGSVEEVKKDLGW